jgi:hypothetical protein
MPLLHENSAFKPLVSKDACAAPQSAGFDHRLTQRMCRPIMVILVQSIDFFLILISFFRFFKIKSCN